MSVLCPNYGKIEYLQDNDFTEGFLLCCCHYL